MILTTVGTQLPFDRLVRAVDCWAAAGEGRDVFAQIGPSTYQPRHVRSARFVSPGEFRQLFQEATVIVAHAGIGTILAALELAKPILIFPRRAGFGEHRNDHQLATARRFEAMGHVNVAWEEEEVVERLDQLDAWHSGADFRPSASPELIEGIRRFLGTAGGQLTGTSSLFGNKAMPARG